MKRNKLLPRPSKSAFDGARSAICLTLASVLLVTGCAPGRGGEVPVRVMLPQQPSAEPVAPGPGAPRVHVMVAPSSALRTVELHEIVGLDRVPYSIQGRYGSVSGATETAVGRRVCAPPGDIVIDGRRGQKFFFTGPGISESSRFKLNREAGDVSFIVSPGRRTVHAVAVPLAGIGGVGVVVGGALMTLSSASGSRGEGAVGGGVLGVGAALLGVGFALLLAGTTTYESQNSDPPLRKSDVYGHP